MLAAMIPLVECEYWIFTVYCMLDTPSGGHEKWQSVIGLGFLPIFFYISLIAFNLEAMMFRLIF